jgi:hypothetical protein
VSGETITYTDNSQTNFLKLRHLLVDSAGNAGLVGNFAVLDLMIEVGNEPTNRRSLYKSKWLYETMSIEVYKDERRTYQITRCNDRQKVLLYASLCDQQRFQGLLGKVGDGKLL